MGDSMGYRAADRMARLPMDKTHVFVLFWLFLAWISEAVDLGGTSYILPSLMQYWGMDTTVGSYYSSLAYVGMFFGAIAAGALADKLGRKKVVIACMLVWGVSGALMAAAPTLEVLFIFRVFLGAGLGAQLPVLMAWVSEILPSKSRGTGLAFFQAMLPVGMLAAALVTLAFLETFGWRVVVLAEAIPAIFLIPIVLFCPESAIWAQAKGKTELAEKILLWWEEKARANTGKELAPVEKRPMGQATAKKATYSDLFTRKGNIAIIVGGFLMMFCSMGGNYGIQTWITQLIALKGFAITNAVLLAGISVLGQIIATPVTAVLCNKLGRKKSAVVFTIVAIVFTLFYGYANSFAMLLIAGICFNFGVGLIVQLVAVIQPEIWDNDQRGAGTGLVSAFGRLGAIAGPILFGMTVGMGELGAFILGVVMFVISAFGIVVLLPETKDRKF